MSPKTNTNNQKLKLIRNILITQDPTDFIDSGLGKLSHSFTTKNSDKLEAGDQLKVLKNKFNSFKNYWGNGENLRNSLNQELDQLSEQQVIISSRCDKMQDRIQYLVNSLANTKIEQEKSDLDQQVNLNIIERTKQNLIHLEIRANSMREDLRQKFFTLNDEKRKKLSSREIKRRSITMYRRLNNSIELEMKEKFQIVKSLGKDFKSRQKQIFKRDDRQRRHAEISEAADNDEKDKKDNQLKEGLFLYRL